MREVLFRGKQKSIGEWVYGNYASTDNNGKQYFIFQNKAFEYEVVFETVGQYIGLTDKNGTKIFEGDIVKGTFLGFPISIEDDVFSICWQEDVAGYKANYFENVEVIGNIYDNPELLETNK